MQFNSLYINMWLCLLNIFEENEFYEIKKISSSNLWPNLYKKGKNE